MHPEYFESPSTGMEIKAVLFDTFGTIVDWRTGIARAVTTFVDKYGVHLESFDFADQWRAEYAPSMASVREGQREYVPLTSLHFENLLRVLRANGLRPEDFAEADLVQLNRGWERLDPWADSIPGLTAIKQQYIVGPLSNGNTALLVNMAKYGGLPWDVVIGSDINRAYKPDPAAYVLTAAVLDLTPGQVMLAAAHNSDLESARDAGLATAFIPRTTEHGPKQTTDLQASSAWDVIASDVVDLAGQLSNGSAADDDRHVPMV